MSAPRQYTAEQVREIRNSFKPYKIGYGRLANRFGGTRETIRDIIRGYTYKDVK